MNEHNAPQTDAHADEWFRHTPDEPTAQHAHGEVKPFFILGFLATVIIITFAVIGLFLVYFNQSVRELTVDRKETPTDIYLADERLEAEANWNTTLNQTPEWQDMDQGFVTLPIDRAEDAVIDMYNTTTPTDD